MPDYSNSKTSGTEVYPENSIANSFGRNEPLITPDQLRHRHLLGIPLVSFLPDPITGKRYVFTNDDLKGIIEGAVATAELELKIDIFPTQRKEKYPFDPQLYQSFMYIKTDHGPVTSVEKLSVTPANGIDIYNIPIEWVEMAYATRRQLNVIPLGIGAIQGSYRQSETHGAAAFFVMLGNPGWVPAYWQLIYTSGFPNGQLPRMINEYIGITAAIDVLSQLAALYRIGSMSQSIDGMSQSTSNPGPAIYQYRIGDLQKKLDSIRGKIQNMFNFKLISGTL